MGLNEGCKPEFVAKLSSYSLLNLVVLLQALFSTLLSAYNKGLSFCKFTFYLEEMFVVRHCAFQFDDVGPWRSGDGL